MDVDWVIVRMGVVEERMESSSEGALQMLDVAGTPLVEKANGWLRAICSRCAKDPNVRVESDDRFKKRESDVTHNCCRCGEHLD